jgi:5'-methylthioinosine phosphorylase
MTLAVIGGTGFGAFAGLENLQDHRIDTQFGEAELQSGSLAGTQILFLPRHGMPARKLPHEINYRANLMALKQQGATRVLAVTAVGTVDPNLGVPVLVVPDQIIDYTYGRAMTIYEQSLHHIDFSEPYDVELRAQVLSAVSTVQEQRPEMRVSPAGVYGCTQGPRLETAAEIRRLARDGCTIVGMTAMPEAALAKELELPYAGLSVTVNPGAGLTTADITLAAIEAAMEKGLSWVVAVLTVLLQQEGVDTLA